jgi:hypothetical protein
MDFENTAAFSRDYQSAQECMCDGEHMFDCSGQDQSDTGRQLSSNLESYLARQFHTSEHKNLVAKKFQPHKVNFFTCLLLPKLTGTVSVIQENILFLIVLDKFVESRKGLY